MTNYGPHTWPATYAQHEDAIISIVEATWTLSEDRLPEGEPAVTRWTKAAMLMDGLVEVSIMLSWDGEQAITDVVYCCRRGIPARLSAMVAARPRHQIIQTTKLEKTAERVACRMLNAFMALMHHHAAVVDVDIPKLGGSAVSEVELMARADRNGLLGQECPHDEFRKPGHRNPKWACAVCNPPDPARTAGGG